MNASITPQKKSEIAVVALRLTMVPMSFLSIVKISSGIRGRGMRRLRTTWLYTRRVSGLNPSVIAIVVGTTLTTRMIILLSQGLM